MNTNESNCSMGKAITGNKSSSVENKNKKKVIKKSVTKKCGKKEKVTETIVSKNDTPNINIPNILSENPSIIMNSQNINLDTETTIGEHDMRTEEEYINNMDIKTELIESSVENNLIPLPSINIQEPYNYNHSSSRQNMTYDHSVDFFFSNQEFDFGIYDARVNKISDLVVLPQVANDVAHRYIHKNIVDKFYYYFKFNNQLYGYEIKCNSDIFYLGEFNENLFRSGIGKLSHMSEGFLYTGGFFNGKFHGRGRITYKDTTVFISDFQNGQILGNMSYSNLLPDAISDLRKWLLYCSIYI